MPHVGAQQYYMCWGNPLQRDSPGTHLWQQCRAWAANMEWGPPKGVSHSVPADVHWRNPLQRDCPSVCFCTLTWGGGHLQVRQGGALMGMFPFVLVDVPPQQAGCVFNAPHVRTQHPAMSIDICGVL